jgi:dipeptidyl-peptidase-4
MARCGGRGARALVGGAVALWWLVAGSVSGAQVQLRAAAELTVERIFGSREFAPDLVSLRWMADGRHYTVVEPDRAGGTHLVRVEAETGRRDTLVRASELVPPGASEPVAIEDYAFSADGVRLLLFTNTVRVWRFNTKGTYFVWDFEARRLSPVSTRPGYQMFAKFSPDGRYVAFVRENDLYVTDLETGAERALTTDGGEEIVNGTSDWVYEEEFDLRDGFRWSPDGRRIAFWRFDQSPIRSFYLIDEMPLYPELVPVRYPKAGTPNSRVRLGVVELETGAVTWVDAGSDSEAYLPRMGFAGSPDEIWFLRMNRHQTQVELWWADVRTGAARRALAEEDSAWIDLHDPIWIRDGREFLWWSERDGRTHLYLYRRDGRLVRQVTRGEFDVTDVFAVDERRGVVYFTGSLESPLTRPVLRVGLDGRGLRRVSEPGGVWRAEFNPQATVYAGVRAAGGEPPVQALYRADGRRIRVLADNGELRERLRTLGLRPPEYLTVPGAAPGVELHAYLLRPPDFDPSKRYPLLLYVYGGPGSQTVTDGLYGDRYLWHQMLAARGYLVASVDNRGTGARGRAFKTATYLKLGQLESDDQIAAARSFAALPYVDPDRIGIWGWSYGGYMAALCLLRGNDVFRMAISVAPVTDWRLYDTIYTERYMRTPQENPEGYERGSALTYADRLRGRLLLVHGTADDNVHPQNTTWLVHRLQEAQKPFELRLYPNKTHAIAGRTTRVDLFQYLTRYVEENL